MMVWGWKREMGGWRGIWGTCERWRKRTGLRTGDGEGRIIALAEDFQKYLLLRFFDSLKEINWRWWGTEQILCSKMKMKTVWDRKRWGKLALNLQLHDFNHLVLEFCQSRLWHVGWEWRRCSRISAERSWVYSWLKVWLRWMGAVSIECIHKSFNESFWRLNCC